MAAKSRETAPIDYPWPDRKLDCNLKCPASELLKLDPRDIDDQIVI